MKARYVLTLVLTMALTGCGGAPLSLLAGGGPKVAANGQAGAVNTQTVGKSEFNAPRVSAEHARRINKIEQSSGDTRVSADRVEKIEVHDLDWRYVLVIALLAGFLIPSPREIMSRIRRAF